MKKKIGNYVEKGEALAYVHANSEEKGQEAVRRLVNCYEIVEEKVEKKSSILKII